MVDQLPWTLIFFKMCRFFSFQGGGGDDEANDRALQLLGENILSMFPTRIDREEAHPDTFANDATGGQPALAVVLTWEIIRFNKLIEVVSGAGGGLVGWWSVVGCVHFDDPQQMLLESL